MGHGNLGVVQACYRACNSSSRGYELMNNLDFEGTKWEDPKGGTFAGSPETGGRNPIGRYETSTTLIPFNATFERNGHIISNLYINRAIFYMQACLAL